MSSDAKRESKYLNALLLCSYKLVHRYRRRPPENGPGLHDEKR